MTSPAASIHPSNLLTYGSLAAGILAIAAALQSSAAGAGAWLALAALLDTFDGRFARRFERSADQQAIGAQLDSLTDAVVFGLAPVIAIAILLALDRHALPLAWWMAAIVYAGSALTRLAHFNVAHESGGFTGLPTPVAALVWSTMLAFGPDATRASITALGLGVAMIAPFTIGRPATRGLTAFAAWPIALLVVHVAHLARS
jgi:CDP-diacylglycerol--serine O-phosphatidyltransferase